MPDGRAQHPAGTYGCVGESCSLHELAHAKEQVWCILTNRMPW